jgi:putative Mn2+ efflux pump MntP
MGLVALFFGGFQALMPLIGWILGNSFKSYIENFDHWVAFVLLSFIGGKMIYEAFQSEDEDCGCFDIKELFIMAIATSIDALAIGVSFAFLRVNILTAAIVIGLTTFCFSVAGIRIGNLFGCRYKSKSEFIGGMVLIIIGAKILLEHLLA